MRKTLIWGDGEDCRKEITTEEELDRVIEQLTDIAYQSKPFTIELSVNTSTAISMIVGLDISLLNFYSSTSQPRYFGSLGPWDETEWIVFYHREHYSETPKTYFVPVADARESFRLYFCMGSRPENIRWT